MSHGSPSASRRSFLTGRALRTELQRAGDHIADALLDSEPAPPAAPALPQAGRTVRLGKSAMACDFDVILNPGGPPGQLEAASQVLDLVDALEDQMTVYRPHSEMSRINQTAAQSAIAVEPQLFDLLCRAEQISRDTDRGFDPTSGPLVALWRRCQHEGRLPDQSEIDQVLDLLGFRHVELDREHQTIRYARAGVSLNLGSIGKGYALDRAGVVLDDHPISDWMLHGGHSSLLARGGHNGCDGWPVGIRNPLFPERRLATLLLRDRGMSTSGCAVQFFRHNGRRYGHLLDPRTGWPVDGMLSVTVLAPTAAEADALSTAFFVIGVEKSRAYCHNRKDIAALIIPPPVRGQRLQPVNIGIPDTDLFFAPDELAAVATGPGDNIA